MRCSPLALACSLLAIGATPFAVVADSDVIVPPSVQTAPLGTPLQVLLPEYRLGSFTHMAEILPARRIARGGPVRDLPRSSRALGPVTYDWRGERLTLEDYLERARVMALVVLKDGRIVQETYRQGARADTPFVSWSMAKSFASTLVGLAVGDGAIGTLDDPVTKYLPLLRDSGYRDNSLRDLLDMSSGVQFIEDYDASDSLEARAWIEGTVTRSVASYTDTFAWFKQRLHPPGTHFYYASIEPAIATWAVKQATGQHPSDYLSEKIWQKIGAEHDASWVLDRPGGIEIGSCCINATARDYARFGLLFLNDGRVGREQVLPAGWVRQVRTPNPERPFLHATQRLRGLPFGYQYNWWLWPEDAQTISAHGVFGQQITVDFDDRVVIVQAANWDRATSSDEHLEAVAVQAAIVRALR
jgi:CubicO group peptidase (beta-lactamase class C family)